MPAGVHNFIVEQGVGYEFTVQYRQGDGDYKDLTDYSARGHIKEKMSACDVLAEFDIEIIEPLEGTLKVSLSPSDLTHVKVKGNRHDSYMECVYDIELYKQEDGEDVEVIRLLNGTVKISPEVTK